MTEMGDANVMGGNVVMPFRKHLVRRKGKVPQMVEYEKEDEGINAPRSILLGRLLDKETGEDIGPFNLPIDDLTHEPSILIEGGPGTGKSVLLARLFSELIFEGRSGVICDFKAQYSTMSEPNSNPKHIAILKEFGEEPRGLGDIDVWLPSHIVFRYGEEFCKMKYGYNKKYTIRTVDMDAGGLLLLGGKATEGRDYVQSLDSLLTRLKRAHMEVGAPYDIQTIMSEMESTKKAIKAKKRSIEALESMMDNLTSIEVIADDGTNPLDLIGKPRTDGLPGKVSIFNTGAAGPDDVQSKGVIANFINGMCTSLMSNDMTEMWQGQRINAWRPVLMIEESSTYFSSKSNPMVMSSFNFLQYVMGRTLGICRVYVYQKKSQMPPELSDSDTMPIYIKTQQYLDLKDEDGNVTGEINMPGLARISVKNVGFMSNQDFYVRILPPRCNIGT